MNDILLMQQEISLVVVFLLLMFYDIFASDNGRKYFQPVACFLFAIHLALDFILPAANGSAFGGMYVSSSATTIMKCVLNIATFIIFLQANSWLDGEGTRHKRGEFFTITLSTLLGMYFMVSAGSFMMLYIGMELASIPLAALAAFDKYKNTSAEAGAKFIMISGFSSAVMMFGLSFIYGAVGSMYFDDVAQKLIVDPLTIMGFVAFFAGLGFKISLVPFHLWTADVYEGAPTTVTAYLSVVSKGAAVFALLFALIRPFASFVEVWQPIIWWVIVITITLGNIFAIRQKDIKRFFAFSSISQAGYIMLGLIAGTAQGMSSTIYYVLVYVFSNLAAFGVISAVEAKSGKVDIASYNGLYSTNPRLSFVMMLSVFSLAGIPIFAGFFSKFFIFAAAAEQGQYLLVFIALLNTVISLFYYLLIIKAMFINKSDNPVEQFSTDGYNKVSLVICSIGILLIGLFSGISEQIGKYCFGM